MRLFVAVVTAAVLATHAFATTINVAEPDAQVCRFPAGSADDPVKRWLSGGAVTCTARSDVTFPEGRWNVFVRTKSRVSVQPVVVDSKAPPASLQFEAVDGATLTAQLPAATTGVVYFPMHASAVPLDGRTVVPANEELWLIVIARGSPITAIPIAPIPSGSERTIDARTPPATRTLLARVHVPDADKRLLQKRDVNSPAVRLKDASAIVPRSKDLDGAFVFFSKVTEGAQQLDLSGRGWLPDRASVTVGKEPLTVLRRPLTARLSAMLVVNWSSVGDLRALDQSLGSCVAPPLGEPRFEIIVSSCVSKEGAEPECRAIRTEPLSPQLTYGTVTVGEVPPGLYRAELHYGKLPVISAMDMILPLQQSPLYLRAQYLGTYGSLTRGGKALDDDADLTFPNGGKGFARRGEDYNAVLLSAFETDAKIEVATCRGERATVLAEEPLRRNSRFNIDIPANELTIRIFDTFTRAALPGATLKYVVLSKNLPRRPVLTLTLKPGGGDDGAIVLKGVPPDRSIILEASCRGYKTQKLDPFSLTKSETKTVEIELVPLQGNDARIISARPFDRASVHWFTQDGVETEHAELADDGTFAYEGPHYKNESMIVVSKSHPLWVTQAPIVERRKPLQVSFPDHAPIRHPRVFLAGYPQRLGTLIGLAIGGVRVPPTIFAEHMALRNLPAFIRGAGPLTIPAIAETNPIDVLRGPSAPVINGNIASPASGREFIVSLTRRVQPGTDDVALEGK